MNTYRGKVLSKFGDNISTDDMTSAKYITSHEPKEVAKICMRDIDPEFPAKMAPGGILVAGKNFGCGSSRETATIAVKAAGTQVVIAESFAGYSTATDLISGCPVLSAGHTRCDRRRR